MSQIVLTFDGIDPIELFGQRENKLNLVRQAFPDVLITSRGNAIKISGEKKMAQQVKSKIEMMARLLRKQEQLTLPMVVDLVNGGELYKFQMNNTHIGTIVHGQHGKAIKARTRNQKRLVEAVQLGDIVFAIGPAGTGKTYTAVALATAALKNRQVKKIILTRPAVEAGESLGFLPGDLQEKVDPYLRPLYDALDDMFPKEKLQHLIQSRTIEVAPLAFMRGRTLDNAFIILDEAQNCTTTQLKMFLTRLGPSAKCIITGDLSQIDLPRNQRSGLFKALDILKGIRGIHTIRFNSDDVVRHTLVKSIIMAYDEARVDRQQEEE